MAQDELKARIAKAQAERAEAEKKTEKAKQAYEPISGAGLALKMSTEMVACVFVGIFIGYALDGWFKTSPLFVLLFLGFGLAAGILGGIRAYRNFNAELQAHISAQNDGPNDGTDPQ